MTKSRKLRIFFAIMLSKALSEAVENRVKLLKKQPGACAIHWHGTEKYHVTLHFLGEVAEEKISVYNIAVAKALQNFPAFTLSLGQLVALPTRHPKILAIAVPLTVELAKLFHTIKIALEAQNFPVETRPYFPHITLGKCQGHMPHFSENNLPHDASFSQKIECITLMQSQYDPLKKTSAYNQISLINLE